MFEFVNCFALVCNITKNRMQSMKWMSEKRVEEEGRRSRVKRKLQKSQIPPLKYIHTINRGVYSILISHCLSGCKKGKGESWLISTIAANWHFATTFNYITQQLTKDSHLRRTRTHTHTQRDCDWDLRQRVPFTSMMTTTLFAGKVNEKCLRIELNWIEVVLSATEWLLSTGVSSQAACASTSTFSISVSFSVPPFHWHFHFHYSFPSSSLSGSWVPSDI